MNYRTIALISAAALGARTCSISIAAANDTAVTALHAEGAQIYECKAEASGRLSWQFREPIAILLHDGATIGRHYAGPRWEIGKSIVLAKANGSPATRASIIKLGR